MLNRAALIVRPREPYLSWAATLDESGLRPGSGGEQTVYLIPVFHDGAHAQAILKSVYADVFERELRDWHTDETDWPTDRSFAAFQRWFDVEMHSVLEDLGTAPIVDDDL